MNPFNFGNPVPPQHMVGRWNQVQSIARDLTNHGGHSHIVIGGRRFGKSSFLKALQHSLLKQIDSKERREWYIYPILIDLQGLSKDCPEGVFGLIVRSLYKCFEPLHTNKDLDIHFDLNLENTQLYSFIHGKQKDCTLDEFSEILDKFLEVFSSSYGLLRLVFLLDEIEIALDKNWTEMFFNQLRSMISQGSLINHLRYVIAGSSRVIDVREQGSPLLNMLNITYLNALENKDILQIINWANAVPSNVIKAVLEQSGGHPFIAQYLMYHIWNAGTSKATLRSVRGFIHKFIHEREADLEKWCVDLGKDGILAYKILAASSNWLTEAQIRQSIDTPDLKTGHGLTTLCYHGLVIHDGIWSKYHISGELFRSWFQNTVLPSMNISNPTIISSQITLNEEPNAISYVNNNPQKIYSKAKDVIVKPKSRRFRAFISYCHKDKRSLDELHTHLAPYVRWGMIDIWDDTNIQPGSKWREEIEKALKSTKVAVLLVSASFLASEFISNIELPSLLAANEREGAIILCVILRPCAFKDTDLAQFQAVNTPSNPLNNMTPGKRDEVWNRVAELVRDVLGKNS